MVRNLGLDGSKGVGTPGVKLPDVSDEVANDGGIDPWDDEPWRDSKPENVSEVGANGIDNEDEMGCGYLSASREKRESEQLKAYIRKSLYGYCDGACTS